MRREKLLVFLFLSLTLAALLSSPAPALADLNLKCQGAILIDGQTGETLYEQNADVKWYPASMTKIMTMILALEAVRDGKASLDDKVIASENACSYGGTQVWLEPGEEFTLNEMLIAIAVGSANDCSVAVAEHFAGTEEAFAEMMNKRARELGAKNTHFVNSHGLHDDDHYTTPYDMAQIARYAITVPHLLDYTSMKEYTFREEPKLLILYNTNKLLWWFEGTRGLKTGTTDEAKRNLTAVVDRGGMTLVSVVMGADETRGHFTESMNLLRYGFSQYGFKSFYDQGQKVATLEVGKGDRDNITVSPLEAVGIIVSKAEKEPDLQVELNLPKFLEAPVALGAEVGTAVILRDGNVVRTVPLVADQEVKRGSLLREFKRVLLKAFSL